MENVIFVLDTSIFEQFRLFEGTAPAGFSVDCLGTITRPEYWTTDTAPYAEARYVRTNVPQDENLVDILPVLQAVSEAKECFSMAELGAGWGRWLVCGAAAARQRGLPFRLTGVEAEPTHFQWMRQHFRDNGINPDEHCLLSAPVAGSCREVWFCVGDPVAWYGQAVVAASTVRKRKDGSMECCGKTVQKTVSIDLPTLLKRTGPLDLIDMDVQGAELEFLSAAPECLNNNVRRVLIGTHSADIEAGLRRLFTGLGWQCEFDFPMGSTVKVKGTQFQMGDGSQSWRRVW